MTPNPFSRRARRTKLDQFGPGHVFWLPRGATWLNRDKPRPYALATPCSPARRGTLVYGSTRETERTAGAACAEVMPVASGVNANGLDARTFFYPGVMLRAQFAELPAHAGVLGKSIGDLRSAIRTALGIGSGSCLRDDAPAGSRRGRIVVLEESLASSFRTPFAALLTEPIYSREKNYHLVVPIRRGEGWVAHPGVVSLPQKDWFGVFAAPTATALVPVQVTQSVWYKDDIVHETRYVLDDESLSALDSHLCAFFGLEPETAEDPSTQIR
jgi:hypothetical protein